MADDSNVPAGPPDNWRTKLKKRAEEPLAEIKGDFARAFAVAAVALGLTILAWMPSYGLLGAEALGSLVGQLLIPTLVTGGLAKFSGNPWSWLKIIIVWVVLAVLLVLVTATSRGGSRSSLVRPDPCLLTKNSTSGCVPPVVPPSV